ncbi:MAG: glycogen/starch synthase [Pseudomonadota bacterium]
MKLLFVTSELAPFNSTGGLAYVSQSFPRQLRLRGVDARIVAPRFGAGLAPHEARLQTVDRFEVVMAGEHQPCELQRLEHDGNLIYFIGNDRYFGRERLYGYPDEAQRFAFFNRAVLALVASGEFTPDVIHCNDWVSALLPYWLRAERTLRAKTVLHIRNLRYQGIFPARTCEPLGLRWPSLCEQGLDFYGHLNLLKLGIRHADLLFTSSPSYAEEILTDGHDPLTPALQQRREALHGVLEGLDLEVDDPRTDARLFQRYGIETAAQGKAANKAALQAEAQLPQRPEVPLVGWINRLTTQKGVELLRLAIANGLLDEDLQLVVCADGDPMFVRELQADAQRHAGKLVVQPYDERTAYRLYAASDLYLMPSVYEPGGIAQLISMRYGSVPVVRATGGLRDTVQPYDPATGAGTGFSFDYRNAWLMLHTLRQALALYRDPPRWQQLVRNAMQRDCSWRQPVDRCLALYDRLLAAP